MKNWLVRLLCVVITIGILFCVPVAAESDPLEDELLGSVSAKYESNGNPGLISTGSGDLGGASYGAYQFSSTYSIPLNFAKWCVTSGNDAQIGNRLQTAYSADGNTFGDTFNKEWKAIASEDADQFLRLQRLYVKYMYYDPAVTALQTYFNLDISQYGIAFKNTVWSRTLQHGLGSYNNISGFLGIMRRVAESLPDGLMGCAEDQLILAIYNESGALTDSGTNAMIAANAGGNAWIIRQYELEGKYMKYFSGNSAAVQAGVYLRLQVNEPKEMLAMFTQYGGYNGYGNGLAVPYMNEDNLVLSDCDTVTGMYGDYTTALSVTDINKKQGSGALSFIPMEESGDLSLSLELSGLTDGRNFGRLSFWLCLPDIPLDNVVLTATLYGEEGTLSVGTLPLGDCEAGWQLVEFTLTEPSFITALQLSFGDLPAQSVGQRFLLDLIQLKPLSSVTNRLVGKVTADGLYCRSYPDSNSQAYGMFLQDTQVVLLGESYQGWYYCYGVDANGNTIVGWCHAGYVRLMHGEYMMGDVDRDGKVNAVDALLTLRYAVDKEDLYEEQIQLADLDGNQTINAVDALMILRIAVNKQ